MLEEISVLETFRRQIKKLTFAFLDLSMSFAGLERREMRMHCDGVYSLRHELVLLIFHESDQRTHNYGETGE